MDKPDCDHKWMLVYKKEQGGMMYQSEYVRAGKVCEKCGTFKHLDPYEFPRNAYEYKAQQFCEDLRKDMIKDSIKDMRSDSNFEKIIDNGIKEGILSIDSMKEEGIIIKGDKWW